eukprot:TRINITY_DN110_c0_g1_i1.p2 TRINITY_DN110_c0_g1~~TRINITY_DN110_c0_g1_i1.p2  ORF type:complete len:131 (+),score=64.38 TRINITY_DN110_c0_g1_i1:50-394(+)
MSVDAVALATKFVELRVAKKNAEAAEMVADDVEWITPTMMGTETHKGKADVTAFWEKQDKDLPTVKDKSDFAADGDLAASRTMTVSKMMIKANLKQTVTFNAEGKIVKSETKKQ